MSQANIHAVKLGGCSMCAQANIMGSAALHRCHYEDQVKIPDHIRDLYERSLIVDALSTPNTFNVDYPAAEEMLTAQQLDSVRRSGITVVNNTIFARNISGHEEGIRLMKRDISQNSDILMLIERSSDILKAKAEGKLGVILGFQGLEFLQEDISLIDAFYEKSVLIMQPTYNLESSIGSGCLSTATDPGLKDRGREAVGRINKLSAVLDLSHSHPQTALDAVKASTDPVIVSHSACHALYAHPRNHPDEVLRAIAGSGGVFGIYLMPFLGNEPTPASRELVTRHLLHALNVCGEDHVGIGSDNSIAPLHLDDGYYSALEDFVDQRKEEGAASPDEGRHPFMVPGLNSPRRLEIIAWDLSRSGCSDHIIEKILGKNFFRVFDKVWN